jgi:hypothetical protein
MKAAESHKCKIAVDRLEIWIWKVAVKTGRTSAAFSRGELGIVMRLCDMFELVVD